MNEHDKKLFLKEFVSSESAVDELIRYAENKFIQKEQSSHLEDDQFLATWENYYQESLENGSFNTLKKYLVQLQFPVKEGMSNTEAYRNTTLKGKQKVGDEFLALNQPETVSFELYESSMGGKVPVIVVPDEEDFNTVICALSNKNEPEELPKSMGALFINGLANWDRIHQLKAAWTQKNPFGNWNQAFKHEMLPKPHLYKDKLFVLSTKGYSGIPASDMQMTEDEWKHSSLIIRREHEFAHLFTLQHYGCMANNIHDEIIADYAGITKVLGHFHKDWLLRFMGLENYPNYRSGGRLQNYQSPISLSKEAFQGLQSLVIRISENLSRFDENLGKIRSSEDHLDRIKCICETDMITMASSEGLDQLMNKYSRTKPTTVL
jgi:hypothetical protein